MVLAASSLRLPGGALGGRRAPRARQPARAALREARVPRLSARGPRRAPRYQVVGRPIPARARPIPQAGGARDLRAAAGRARCCSSPARSPARARSTRLVIEAFAEVGPAILHISGERDYRALQASRAPRRLPPDPLDRPDRRRLLGRRPRARAGRAARSGRSPRPGSPRSSCPIRSRPPTTRRRTRSTSSQAGGAMMIRDLDLDDVPDRVRSLLDDPPAARANGGARCCARPSRTPPRRSPKG